MRAIGLETLSLIGSNKNTMVIFARQKVLPTRLIQKLKQGAGEAGNKNQAALFIVARSITNRYFTSLLSMRS